MPCSFGRVTRHFAAASPDALQKQATIAELKTSDIEWPLYYFSLAA